MRLIIQPDYNSVAEWIADYVVMRMRTFNEGKGPTAERPFVLGTCGGNTMKGTWQALVARHKAGAVSFRHVVTFMLDEYVGIPRDDPMSQHTYMWSTFVRHVDLPPGQCHVLDGNAADPNAECASFEARIAAAGGIELLCCSTGEDGHVARNEPGSSLTSRTRPKTLAYDTLLALKGRFGGDVAAVPKICLTMGMQTIMDAREVICVFCGVRKAPALERAIEQGINHMFPVSILQRHPRSCFICDEDATMELKMKTVHYFQGLQETAKLKKVQSKAHAASSIPPSPALFHPSQDPTGDGGKATGSNGAGAGAGAGAGVDTSPPAAKKPRLMPQHSM